MEKLPSCPRPTKEQKAKRVKMAITMDTTLYDLLQEKYQEGYSVSHLIDSCIWECFGRPKLSFEKEPKSKPIKCCGE